MPDAPRPRTPRSRHASQALSSQPFALILNLQRATHAVGTRLEARLADHEVSHGEAHMLALLSDGSPQSVGDLQRGLLLRPSTVSGILERLERRRLLTRRLSDVDRRSLLVRLTPGGRKLASSVVATLEEFEAAARRSLVLRDITGFQAVLQALGESTD